MSRGLLVTLQKCPVAPQEVRYDSWMLPTKRVMEHRLKNLALASLIILPNANVSCRSDFYQ